MVYYKCSKCNCKTKNFHDIIDHILKKSDCVQNLDDGFSISEDVHLILTLIPYDKDDKHMINRENMKKYSNIYTNKRILLKKFQNNYNKNLIEKKTCEYCKKSFPTIQKLRHHIIIDCFQNEVNETLGLPSIDTGDTIPYDEVFRLDKPNNITINNDNSKNIIINNDNSQHIHIHQNNLYLNISNPVSFSESWDLSQMDDAEKHDILLSTFMYSEFLTSILENKKNLNVIIDKNKTYGFVYDNDKYVKMNINDINEKSIDKIRQNLVDINNELFLNVYGRCRIHKHNQDDINKRHYLFSECTSDRLQAINALTTIYSSKRKEALEVYNETVKNNNLAITDMNCF